MKGRGERRIVTDGREAPTCRVRFRCPTCRREVIEDAYGGTQSCRSGHPVTFMRPVSLCEKSPDSEDARGLPALPVQR